MLELLFRVLTYLLAVYGALFLCISVFNSIYRRTKPESMKVKLVLMVKDQEKTIEGIIRSILAGDFIRRVIPGEKLAVVDMGSSDKTRDILLILGNDYECMEVLREDEKEKIFTYFDDEKK